MEDRGYASAEYARSLVHMGEPIALTRSGGWLIRRPLPESVEHDASGPYPLLSVARPEVLADDLASLDPALISVTAVLDPMMAIDEAALRRAFPDHLVPFKEHFVVDLEGYSLDRAARYHRRKARAALRRMTTETFDPRGTVWDDWLLLYDGLVERHEVEGPAAFSRASFELLRHHPDLIGYRASIDGGTVGMQLWMMMGDRVSFHLGASSEKGYRTAAAFGLMASAIEDFRRRGLDAVHLGAGAGLSGNSDDGLSRFKRGWSTGTRTAWLGGRILDEGGYARRVAARGIDIEGREFFPLYRRP